MDTKQLEELIVKVEEALRIKLTQKQKKYLVFNRNVEWGKGQGRTTIHCIRKALVIDREDALTVLDISRPQEFSDKYSDIPYSRNIYRPMFLMIWLQLLRAKIPVVKIIKHRETKPL